MPGQFVLAHIIMKMMAAFLALSKFGSNIATSSEMIDMTTSNSISIKPRLVDETCEDLMPGMETTRANEVRSPSCLSELIIAVAIASIANQTAAIKAKTKRFCVIDEPPWLRCCLSMSRSRWRGTGLPILSPWLTEGSATASAMASTDRRQDGD